MKLLQKLGSRAESANSTNLRQWGLFECPVCKEQVERSLSHGRRNKSCGKSECRKAVFSNPNLASYTGKDIQINNTTVTTRNQLKYFAGFRAWYNRLDSSVIHTEIDTIEKAANMLYVEYEIAKIQYPNQKIAISLIDISKPITKDNSYFIVEAQATGTSITQFMLNKLNRESRLSKNKIMAMLNETGLDLIKDYDEIVAKCITEKYSHSKQTEYVYLIRAGSYTKIGVAEDPEKRIKEISVGCPFKPEIVATKALGKLCYLVERYLHIQYADKCTNGEWFELDEVDVKTIIDTPEDELVMIAAKTINTNKEAYVESTRVYNDESKLSKLRIEAEERYLQTCANYEESKRKAREANKKPVIETTHEHGDARFTHDRTNQIEATTTHGMVGTAIYAAWQTVKKIYGVSKEWEQFEQFMKDIGVEYDAFAAEDIARVYPVDTANPVSPINYVIKAKKDHIVKSAVARSVLQLKDGEVIAEYNSVTEAAKSVDGIASKISSVCKGNRKTHAGFGWYYKE